MDSPENHTPHSLLNRAACCGSGPDVLDGRGWTSVLRPVLISDNVQSSKLKKKKGNGNSKQLRPKFLKKLEQTNKTFFYICIKKTSSLVFDIQIISILSISQYVMYFALLIRQKKFTLFRGKSPPWGEQKPVRTFCILLLEI